MEKFSGDGWIRLFEVCLCDRYETQCLKHALAGTLTVIKGGEVHKGSRVTDGLVQSVLFFTGLPPTKVSYNSDVQHMAITVFCQICARMWPLHIDLRPALIEILLILLQQCDPTYRKKVQIFFNIQIRNLILELSLIGHDCSTRFSAGIVK